MIFYCPSCGVQYQCEQLEPGMVYRCSCGEVIVLSKISPKDPKVLYCSSCGGPLTDGARECSFCAGVVSMYHKNLGGLCPSCFTRLPNGARNCFNCGVKIDPLDVGPEGTGKRCPRCDVELEARPVAAFNVIECKRCGGLWLSEQTFKEICWDRKERAQVARALFEKDRPHYERSEKKIVYLKCPDCGKHMNRKRFGKRSGVILDRCKDHGIWLDCHELEIILDFIDSGGVEHVKRSQEASQVRMPKAPRSLFKVSRYGQVAHKGATPAPRSDPVLQDIFDLLK